MLTYQSYVVFRSFSDLYCEEMRQEGSSNNSRSSSICDGYGAPMIAYGAHAMRRTSTQVSNDRNRAPLVSHAMLTRCSPRQSSLDTSSDASAQYYPAALYNSQVARKMAARESDTATLADDISSEESNDLSLRRF